MNAHDPRRHHRRSIRLRGRDYSGTGIYFVTICAHREFIRFACGAPFGAVGATCVSPVRGIIEEEWRRGGELRDDVFPGEFVVMPDHFHGLIRIGEGPSELGHVIGAFKAAVSRRVRRRGDTHVAPDTHVPEDVRIWHRNYYEMIVRTPQAERNIRDYIRMNPWKLVQHATCEGQSYRMIGNPSLLNAETIGVLCSRSCPADVLAAAQARVEAAVGPWRFIGGFHAPSEKALLRSMLRGRANVLCCPAWGVDAMKIPGEWLPALEANRMLILEMRNRDGDLAAAEERSRFVLASADKLWLPYVAPGGMLERLVGDD